MMDVYIVFLIMQAFDPLWHHVYMNIPAWKTVCFSHILGSQSTVTTSYFTFIRDSFLIQDINTKLWD